MTKEELRIGNYVSGGEDHPYLVVENLLTDKALLVTPEGQKFFREYSLISPIDITEDWLTNLGFRRKQRVDRSIEYIYTLEDPDDCFINRDAYIYFHPQEHLHDFITMSDYIDSSYVHDIQNKMYAIYEVSLSLRAGLSPREKIANDIAFFINRNSINIDSNIRVGLCPEDAIPELTEYIIAHYQPKEETNPKDGGIWEEIEDLTSFAAKKWAEEEKDRAVRKINSLKTYHGIPLENAEAFLDWAKIKYEIYLDTDGGINSFSKDYFTHPVKEVYEEWLKLTKPEEAKASAGTTPDPQAIRTDVLINSEIPQEHLEAFFKWTEGRYIPRRDHFFKLEPYTDPSENIRSVASLYKHWLRTEKCKDNPSAGTPSPIKIISTETNPPIDYTKPIYPPIFYKFLEEHYTPSEYGFRKYQSHDKPFLHQTIADIYGNWRYNQKEDYPKY